MSSKLRFALLATAAVLLPAHAFAQETEGGIEEVIVTAQKRAQRTVDVPIALTAYSGKKLEELGVQEFDKLSLFVPGFEVQNQSPNNPGFVMRGITSDSGEATQEPRVSVFQDGVSISKSRGSYVELFDVERIEVAKGPQTTLFGRGALIGAVNIVQNKANLDDSAAAARFEAGDYNYRMAEGMVNIPLTDTFGVRFSGRYKTRDGYTDNLLGGEDFNSQNTGAVRAALGWEPSSALRADLIVNYQRDTPSGTGFKSGTFNPTNPATGAPIGDLSHNSGAALSSSPAFEDGKPLGLERTVWGATGLLTYHLNDAYTVSSISAYRRFHSLEVFDPDGFSLPMLAFAEDAQGKQASQELRLNYDEGGPLTYFVGASYFWDSGSQAIPLHLDERMALALLTGQLTVPNPQPAGFFDSTAFKTLYGPAFVAGLAGAYGVALTGPQALGIAQNLQADHQEMYTNYGKTRSYDFYGEATYHVTEQLELTAGLRYSHDDKTSAVSASTVNGRSILGGLIGALGLPASPTRTALLNGLATPGAYSTTLIPPAFLPNFGVIAQPTANNGDKISQDFSDAGFTWRLAARYALAPDTSLYASYGRGRRPDVLSAAAPSTPYGAPNFTPVEAETVDSYEAGYKTIALDGDLSFDASVYLYNYENFQTTIQQGAILITTNAGTARAYGAEAQVNWAIAPMADLFATYAYGHARFTGDSIFKGNQFRLTPDHKLSVGLSLRHDMLDGVFTLTPTYTWQSKVYFDDDNDIPALQAGHILPDFVQDEFQRSYGLVNVRLGYAPEGGIWNVEVFANNVLNQKFIKDAGNTGDAFGIPTFIAGEPRMVGVSLSVKSQ